MCAADGSTTEHTAYNNYVVNSLSFAKCPLEALDSNGGLTGEWTDSRTVRGLNNGVQDVCNDTGFPPPPSLSFSLSVSVCMRLSK